MDKLQVIVSPEDWGDLVTKYAPHSKKVKVGDFTNGTKNIDTDVKGYITKRKGGPNYNSVALSGPAKDQYEAIFSDGVRHLLVVTGGEFKYSSGDTTFNTVQNGSGFTAGANFEFVTTQNRVYGGNGTANVVYDRTTSYGGVAYTAPRIKTMGCQAPSAPATAPAAGAAGGSVPAGAHTYKVTFLYYDSEESNGSAASGVCTVVAPNQTVGLTAVPVGGYGVTARKIYRDDNDGNYTLIGTISNNTATTYSDTLAVGAVPTPMPTDNGVPSPFTLAALWLEKIWTAGITGEPFTLRHSEAGLPDIFPGEYEVICNQEDPITALVVYFARLVVFNRKSFGQISGNSADTFRYEQIPGSVGCVDNRTLQTRVIKGVPILIWLSDRGFYSYDGNAINYISDPIEDLVNFNIQQAIQQKNSNTQSTQAAFQGGTASQGIDLISEPGSIIQKGYADGSATVGNNPRRNWDDEADWESGSSTANCRTNGGVDYNGNDVTNRLAMPRIVGWDPTGGVHAGTVTTNPGDGYHIELTAATTLATESTSSGTNTGSATHQAIAAKFIPASSGTVASGYVSGFSATTHQVYSHDSTNDRPNVALGAVGTVAVTAGTTYWLVRDTSYTGTYNLLTNTGAFLSVRASVGNKAMRKSGGTWFALGTTTTGTGLGNSIYTITTTPVATGGSWTSTIADSYSNTPTPYRYYVEGSYPSGTSATLTVQSSASASFASVDSSLAFVNPNGLLDISSMTGYRYWRTVLVLTTTNNLNVPTVGGQPASNTSSFVAEFNRTATWISAAIDCTADVTAYNSLDSVVQITGAPPFVGGTLTTVTVTVATSADDVTYSAYSALGSAVVARYIKIKVVMTSGTDSGAIPLYHTATPNVTSLILKWTIVSNLVSSAIDTAVTPAGWDLFLATSTLNGGTIQYQMRSAASSLGLAAAVWTTVTSGDFPVVTPLQWVQWKVILTATDLAVPVVEAVTIQWFIADTSSIRPASIFVDGRYYVALAGLQQTTNSILLGYDLNGKWRRYNTISIATFSYFFNRPYIGLGDTGTIRKFIDSSTDNGSAIEADVRTKAFDFSTQYKDASDKVKVVGPAVLQVKNTGATYKMYYSVDLGTTFYPMYLDDGTTDLVTTTDGLSTYRTFKPSWTSGVPFAGQTIMYRFYSNDLYEMEIQGFKGNALLRTQEPM